MLPLLATLAALVVLHLMSYFWHRQLHQKRAADILRWVESTLGTHGDLNTAVWMRPSEFRIALDTRPDSLFRRAAVRVLLTPRELLHRWINYHLRGDAETITFEADFEVAPRFELDLHSLKLFARTRCDLEPTGEGWQFEQVTPLVLTTTPREQWQREMAGVISALLHLKEKHFLHLRLQPSSPHYLVTLPLSSITPDSAARLQLASVIRELAVEASSYHGLNS